MCCNVALQLGFTDSDAPVFCRTYKVPLTSLIQLLNQSEKADGGFQLFFFIHFVAIAVICLPPRHTC